MPLLDIFDDDAFSTVSMIAPIEKIETVPNHLGAMGIFNEYGVRDEKVAIEDRAGTLRVIQTSKRGEELTGSGDREKRNIRDFRTTRIAEPLRVKASELAFLRQFGEEQMRIEAMAEIMRLMSGPNGMLADVETTWEHMRLGAVQGVVLDADNSQIYDYFTEFGIAQPDLLYFDLANKKDGELREYVQANVVRAMRRKAKGIPIRGVEAICGDAFWDALRKNAEVRETYLAQSEARDLRGNYDLEVFEFAGVKWQNYVGTDDNQTVAIGDDVVKFFPSGNVGVFDTVFAPGESFADIGQRGVPIYPKIIPDTKRDFYVDIELYSYPLFVVRRPDLLLRGTRIADPG